MSHPTYSRSWRKIGPEVKNGRKWVFISLVASYTIGKPTERRLIKAKIFLTYTNHSLLRSKAVLDAKWPETILSLKMSQQGCSSSTILLEMLQDADLEYKFWHHFVPKIIPGSQNYNGVHRILLCNISFNLP